MAHYVNIYLIGSPVVTAYLVFIVMLVIVKIAITLIKAFTL